MSSRPGDFNQTRCIGQVESVERRFGGGCRIVGFVLSVQTGHPFTIAVLPGKAILPGTLHRGDLVEVRGELEAFHESRRAILFAIAADYVDVITKGGQHAT